MWMYFFHFFSLLSTCYVPGSSRFTSQSGNTGRKWKNQYRDYCHLGYMLWGGWREGVVWGGSIRPGQSRWSLGVGGRVMKREGAGSWALHWFSILAALKRDHAGCMASAGGVAQGDEEAGEGLGLGVWEVGDPRPSCGEPLWEWGLASQSDPAWPLWPLTLLISFLSGLSKRGAGDGSLWELPRAPQPLRRTEPSQETPTVDSFPPRSPSEWAEQERLLVSSGLPRATPWLPVTALCATPWLPVTALRLKLSKAWLVPPTAPGLVENRLTFYLKVESGPRNCTLGGFSVCGVTVWGGMKYQSVRFTGT